MLRTTRQRRILCRDCPVARTADITGDSISLIIMRDIIEKPRRFGDFELSLAGVSTRTISKKLKELEKQGLIKRDESKRLESRIDYRITKKGAAFRGVIHAMRAYGKRYL